MNGATLKYALNPFGIWLQLEYHQMNYPLESLAFAIPIFASSKVICCAFRTKVSISFKCALLIHSPNQNDSIALDKN